MKESITKFDLESAFKALDEIEIPKVGKVKANRPALTEIFSRKTKFDALMEEYYDIGSSEGLEGAKDAREAEIAQAKLARIEKIVDLDAESAEDLLTSYVGKFIIQCPQCMTLFYKDQEDVVAAEEDPSTVNVNEVCQHCGNESGYSLIGKVGEAEPEVEEEPAFEEGELDLDIEDDEIAAEAGAEEVASEEEDLNFDAELEKLDLDIEDEEEPAEEEEKKEEAFTVHTGESLVEDIQDEKDLDAKLDAHSEYIEYLRDMISQEEAALEKTENAQVKDAIQRRIDAFKVDLEAALPEAVKNDNVAEEPVEEVEAPAENTETAKEIAESLTRGFSPEKAWELARDLGRSGEDGPGPGVSEYYCNECHATYYFKDEDYEYDGCCPRCGEHHGNFNKIEEALHEDTDTDVSDAEFDQLMNSSEFKKPISDTAVRAMLAMEKDEEAKKEESLDTVFDDVEELQEAALESMISDSLVELYDNVAGFRLKDCSYEDSKFMVEGVIHFTSGNMRTTAYVFNEALVEADKVTLRGLNEKLGNDKQFFITGYTEGKTFITESFKTAKN